MLIQQLFKRYMLMQASLEKENVQSKLKGTSATLNIIISGISLDELRKFLLLLIKHSHECVNHMKGESINNLIKSLSKATFLCL